MKPILGIVTIGQTPRPDLAEAFGAEAPHVEVRVAGALDGILPDDLAALRNPGTSASPDFDYPLLVRLASGAHIEVPRAAGELRGADLDLIVIDCMGHADDARRAMAKWTGKLVIAAQSVVAKVAGAMI